MKKQMRTAWIAVVIGVCSVILLMLVTSSYYHNVLQGVDKSGTEDGTVYQYHYVMIVNDSDMPFWQDVYHSTTAAAKENDALVELMGKSLSSANGMEDLMDMAIAAKVDGIILEYMGGYRMDEKIREAKTAGIPVVTILKDAPNSERVSFVGVNAYQMGRQYGECILKLIPQGKKEVEVMVLLHDEDSDNSQSQIFEQINNLLVTSKGSSGYIKMSEENMQSTGKVDADETMRNIFFREEGAPDILVCTEAVDTEAAYQALIDYNKVGDVQVVGYYKSDQILEAVEKGNIPVTLVIDTEQMGRYCVEALNEYLEEGRANSYYSVDLQFITKENVDAHMKSE